MTELLMWGAHGVELGVLEDALRSAMPDCELVHDRMRVWENMLSPLGESAYDPVELRERQARDADVMRAPVVHDVVALVLPTVAAVTLQAAVEAAVGWLRGLRTRPRGEKTVLIYGPDGEPLRKVRVRDGAEEPEVFAPPWPLPTDDVVD